MLEKHNTVKTVIIIREFQYGINKINCQFNKRMNE